MHICKAGLHCTTLTGMTADGRCLACRRESHRRAQRTYDKSSKGKTVDDRYEHSAKGMLNDARYNARNRA